MDIIKNLRVYDADDTLLFTPKPDADSNGEKVLRFETINGKKNKFLTSEEFEKATGIPWQHRGWWARRESLDMDIFDIKKNGYVYNEYLKDKAGIDKHIAMMTGRIKPLEKQVRKILDHYGFEFDEYYFNPGGMNTLDYKIGVFDKYVKENIDLETIKMYDDRDEHIPDFMSWAEKTMNDTGIDIEIIHVRGEGRVN